MLFSAHGVMHIDLKRHWIAIAEALAFTAFIHLDLDVYRGRATIT